MEGSEAEGSAPGAPPSPLSGGYLLIVLGEPYSALHKGQILRKIQNGFLSWDKDACHVDLEKELQLIASQAPEGEESKNGERLIQFASENLVTEVLIHPTLNTLTQCIRNLLSSFTRHRHIIHAGYTFTGNGSWIIQDGTFSLADLIDAFQEPDVLRVLRAYENTVSVDIHCAPEGDWSTARMRRESFSKLCCVRVNPDDSLTPATNVDSFMNYISKYLQETSLEQLLEPSEVVGNIRFSHPTLYVFPGGQGDAALFGINGFNMLVDGGFSRKACFWDFTRHLDRLDAVLITRLNNSNCNGIGAVLQRKKQAHVYPQIGHFFCNIQERRQPQSPEGEKERDSLLINLADEGQEMVYNLRHLHLKPHFCSRDSTIEPINLYHKVGHGKLDMYVLSPAKDSRDLKEFLSKWHTNDQSLFGSSMKKKGEFHFPLNNLVSICSLLVWQPANPNETITRLLFPGSAPQHKIFEGLEKLKNLEFLKHPVCSAKTLSPSSSTLGMTIRTTSKTKPVPAVIDKLLPGEGLNRPVSKTISSVESVNKQNVAKSATIPVAAPIAPDMKPKITSAQKPAIQKQPKSEKIVDESNITKTEIDMDKDKNKLDKNKVDKDKNKIDKDKLDSDKDVGKEKESETETKETEGKIIPSKLEKPPKALIDSKSKTEQKVKSKSKSDSKQTSKNVERKPSKTPSIEKKGDSVKSSPTTPKKTIDTKTQKPASTRAPSKSRASPSATPAKSAKEENNRKVVESKRSAAVSRSAPSKQLKKEFQKTEKKVTKRPPTASPSKAPLKSESPKKPVSKVSKLKVKKESKKEKPEADKGVATDSSTVSTPSTAEAEITATKLKDTDKEKESFHKGEVSDKENTVDQSEQENIDEVEKLSDRLEDEGIEKDVELTDKGDNSDDGIKVTIKDELTAEKSLDADEETGEEKFTKETAEDLKEDDSLRIRIQEKDESERDEEDEILIIEKVEIEPYIDDSMQDQESIDSHEVEEIEDELQKHLRDETESEKKLKSDLEKSDQGSVKKDEELFQIEKKIEKDGDKATDGILDAKISGKVEKTKTSSKPDLVGLDLKKLPTSDILSPENKEQIEGEVQGIITSATEFVAKTKMDGKDTSEISAEGIISDDLKSSGDAKDLQDIQYSDDKNIVQKYDQLKEDEVNKSKDLADVKYGAEESQPDEKLSTTIESGATTAPTLPEDERIPLDEIKEGIEEKHVKEETKEKDIIPPASKVEQPTSLPEIAVGSSKTFEGRIQVTRDIVKTPDEVADLPVHEEVDAELYESEELSGRDFHRSKDDLLGVSVGKKITSEIKDSKERPEKDSAQEKKIAQVNDIKTQKTEKNIVELGEESPKSDIIPKDLVPLKLTGEEVEKKQPTAEDKDVDVQPGSLDHDKDQYETQKNKFYRDLGVVEEPVHTTIKAPEVAEYVMLTPDSTPDSPIPRDEVKIVDKEVAQSSKDEKDIDTKLQSTDNFLHIIKKIPEEATTDYTKEDMKESKIMIQGDSIKQYFDDKIQDLDTSKLAKTITDEKEMIEETKLTEEKVLKELKEEIYEKQDLPKEKKELEVLPDLSREIEEKIGPKFKDGITEETTKAILEETIDQVVDNFSTLHSKEQAEPLTDAKEKLKEEIDHFKDEIEHLAKETIQEEVKEEDEKKDAKEHKDSLLEENSQYDLKQNKKETSEDILEVISTEKTEHDKEIESELMDKAIKVTSSKIDSKEELEMQLDKVSADAIDGKKDSTEKIIKDETEIDAKNIDEVLTTEKTEHGKEIDKMIKVTSSETDSEKELEMQFDKVIESAVEEKKDSQDKIDEISTKEETDPDKQLESKDLDKMTSSKNDSERELGVQLDKVTEVAIVKRKDSADKIEIDVKKIDEISIKEETEQDKQLESKDLEKVTDVMSSKTDSEKKLELQLDKVTKVATDEKIDSAEEIIKDKTEIDVKKIDEVSTTEKTEQDKQFESKDLEKVTKVTSSKTDSERELELQFDKVIDDAIEEKKDSAEKIINEKTEIDVKIIDKISTKEETELDMQFESKDLKEVCKETSNKTDSERELEPQFDKVTEGAIEVKKDSEEEIIKSKTEIDVKKIDEVSTTEKTEHDKETESKDIGKMIEVTSSKTDSERKLEVQFDKVTEGAIEVKKDSEEEIIDVKKIDEVSTTDKTEHDKETESKDIDKMIEVTSSKTDSERELELQFDKITEDAVEVKKKSEEIIKDKTEVDVKQIDEVSTDKKIETEDTMNKLKLTEKENLFKTEIKKEEIHHGIIEENEKDLKETLFIDGEGEGGKLQPEIDDEISKESSGKETNEKKQDYDMIAETKSLNETEFTTGFQEKPEKKADGEPIEKEDKLTEIPVQKDAIEEVTAAEKKDELKLEMHETTFQENKVHKEIEEVEPKLYQESDGKEDASVVKETFEKEVKAEIKEDIDKETIASVQKDEIDKFPVGGKITSFEEEMETETESSKSATISEETRMAELDKSVEGAATILLQTGDVKTETELGKTDVEAKEVKDSTEKLVVTVQKSDEALSKLESEVVSSQKDELSKKIDENVKEEKEIEMKTEAIAEQISKQSVDKEMTAFESKEHPKATDDAATLFSSKGTGESSSSKFTVKEEYTAGEDNTKEDLEKKKSIEQPEELSKLKEDTVPKDLGPDRLVKMGPEDETFGETALLDTGDAKISEDFTKNDISGLEKSSKPVISLEYKETETKQELLKDDIIAVDEIKKTKGEVEDDMSQVSPKSSLESKPGVSESKELPEEIIEEKDLSEVKKVKHYDSDSVVPTTKAPLSPELAKATLEKEVSLQSEKKEFIAELKIKEQVESEKTGDEASMDSVKSKEMQKDSDASKKPESPLFSEKEILGLESEMSGKEEMLDTILKSDSSKEELETQPQSVTAGSVTPTIDKIYAKTDEKDLRKSSLVASADPSERVPVGGEVETSDTGDQVTVTDTVTDLKTKSETSKSPKSTSPLPAEHDKTDVTKEIAIQKEKSVALDTVPVTAESTLISEVEPEKLSDEDQHFEKLKTDKISPSDSKTVSPKSISPVPSDKQIKDLLDGKLSVTPETLLKEKSVEIETSESKDISPKSISPVPREDKKASSDVTPKSVSPVLGEDRNILFETGRLVSVKTDAVDQIALDSNKISLASISPEPAPKATSVLSVELKLGSSSSISTDTESKVDIIRPESVASKPILPTTSEHHQEILSSPAVVSKLTKEDQINEEISKTSPKSVSADLFVKDIELDIKNESVPILKDKILESDQLDSTDKTHKSLSPKSSSPTLVEKEFSTPKVDISSLTDDTKEQKEELIISDPLKEEGIKNENILDLKAISPKSVSSDKPLISETKTISTDEVSKEKTDSDELDLKTVLPKSVSSVQSQQSPLLKHEKDIHSEVSDKETIEFDKSDDKSDSPTFLATTLEVLLDKSAIIIDKQTELSKKLDSVVKEGTAAAKSVFPTPALPTAVVSQESESLVEVKVITTEKIDVSDLKTLPPKSISPTPSDKATETVTDRKTSSDSLSVQKEIELSVTQSASPIFDSQIKEVTEGKETTVTDKNIMQACSEEKSKTDNTDSSATSPQSLSPTPSEMPSDIQKERKFESLVSEKREAIEEDFEKGQSLSSLGKEKEIDSSINGIDDSTFQAGTPSVIQKDISKVQTISVAAADKKFISGEPFEILSAKSEEKVLTSKQSEVKTGDSKIDYMAKSSTTDKVEKVNLSESLEKMEKSSILSTDKKIISEKEIASSAVFEKDVDQKLDLSTDPALKLSSDHGLDGHVQEKSSIVSSELARTLTSTEIIKSPITEETKYESLAGLESDTKKSKSPSPCPSETEVDFSQLKDSAEKKSDTTVPSLKCDDGSLGKETKVKDTVTTEKDANISGKLTFSAADDAHSRQDSDTLETTHILTDYENKHKKTSEGESSISDYQKVEGQMKETSANKIPSSRSEVSSSAESKFLVDSSSKLEMELKDTTSNDRSVPNDERSSKTTEFSKIDSKHETHTSKSASPLPSDSELDKSDSKSETVASKSSSPVPIDKSITTEKESVEPVVGVDSTLAKVVTEKTKINGEIISKTDSLLQDAKTEDDFLSKSHVIDLKSSKKTDLTFTESLEPGHSNIQSSKTDQKCKDIDPASSNEESSTVHRMVVTASSEDGGSETEICTSGSIKFSPEIEQKEKLSKASDEISTSQTKATNGENASSGYSEKAQDEKELSELNSVSGEDVSTCITTTTTTTTIRTHKDGSITKVTTVTHSDGGKPDVTEKPSKSEETVEHVEKMVKSDDKTTKEADLNIVKGVVETASHAVKSLTGDVMGSDTPILGVINELKKDAQDITRSGTPGSDMSERELDIGGPSTPHSEISSGQVSRAATNVWGESSEGRADSQHYDSDDDVPCSPLSVTSHMAISPPQFDFELQQGEHDSFMETDRIKDVHKIPSTMTSSFYGSLPEDDSGFDRERQLFGTDEGAMYSSMYIPQGYEAEDEKPIAISEGDEKIGQFEAMFRRSSKEDVDFETARKEHYKTRGEDLTKKDILSNGTKGVVHINGKDSSTMNGGGISSSSSTSLGKVPDEKPKEKPSPTGSQESVVIKSKKVESTSSTPPKPTAPSSSVQGPSDTSVDPIQSWGKPLGLPPPPLEKNRWFPTWDPIEEWGKPLGLPTPAPPLVKKDSTEDVEVDLTQTSNKTTPKKVAKKNMENNKSASYTPGGKEVNTKSKRSESPVKRSSNKENRKSTYIYLDLSYVPHNGNSHYTTVEFFKRVRARYYVFSGTEPSKDVFNALLEAKQTWEDKDLEVTIIPTYDTDILGYWVAENEELLAKYKIDLSPSASRCTINLQDHETSCSAYRLEF